MAIPRAVKPPRGSRVRVDRSEYDLELIIPGDVFSRKTLARLGSAVLLLAFTVYWTWAVLPTRGSLGFGAFSIFFFCVGALELGHGLFYAFGSTRFTADVDTFEVSRCIFGFTWTRTGATSELDRAEIKVVERNTRGGLKRERFVVIRAGVREHCFGHQLGAAEQEWIAKVLNKFLKSARRALRHRVEI